MEHEMQSEIKKYSLKSKINCPYCKTKQEYPAGYYVSGGNVEQEMCQSCDQIFQIKKTTDGMVAVDSNWTRDIELI